MPKSAKTQPRVLQSPRKRKKDLRFVIITPSYNQAKFIEETLQSVLSQPGVDVEYWVMDGKSNDGTHAVLRKFARRKFARKQLHWISAKDKGQTDALNRGLHKAHWLKSSRGELDRTIVAYLNSDDAYLPGALAQVAATFRTHVGVQWVVGDCEVIDEHGQQIHQPIAWYKRVVREVYAPWILQVLNPIPQPATFWRASVLRKVGMFNDELRYVMDYEYWLRLQRACGAPYFIDQPLAKFRVHGQSKGGRQFTAQFREQFAVAKKQGASALLLFLQRCHNWLTITTYRAIK